MPIRANTLERLRTWRRYTLLGGAALVPIVFVRNAADAMNVPKLSLLMLCVSVAALLFFVELAQARELSGIKRLAFPAAVMLVPLTVAWLFSAYRGWSLMGDYPRYLGFLPYAVTIFYGLLVAETFRDRAQELGWAITAAGGVVGAYAVVQVVGLDPLTWTVETRGFAASTLGNPNFTGGFLAMCLPVAAALLLTTQRRLSLGIAITLVLGGLIASSSQAAVGAAVAAGGVMGGIVLSARWQLARLVGFAVAALIAVSSIALTVVGALGDSGAVPESLERRGEWWSASLSIAADSPIVGNGPSTFALEHSRHRSERDVTEAGFSVERDPHSLPMSLLAGAGVLGALGYVGLVSWVVRTSWLTRQENIVAAGFAAAAVAYLVQMLVSVDVVALRATFWGCLGGLAASVLPAAHSKNLGGSKKKRLRRQPAGPVPSDPRMLVACFVGASAALVLGWWGIRLFAADLSVAAANEAARDGTFATARSELMSAIDRVDNPDYRQRLGTYLADVAVTLGTQQRLDAAEQVMEESEEVFSYAAELPDVHGAMAYARALHGWTQVSPERASDVIDLYERAIELDPNNYFLRIEAGEVALSLRRWADAERFISEALEQRPDLAVSAALALALAQQGEVEEARRALNVARQGPGEPYLDEAENALNR